MSIVGHQWADVDLDAGGIDVCRIVSMSNGQRAESTPSPSAQRTVSIGDRTLVVLVRLQAGADDVGTADPVFEKRDGGELNPESISNTFRGVLVLLALVTT